jgi:hypothetical protein
MKPMSLLTCGIVVSLLGAAVPMHAESQTGNIAALRADTQTSLQAWKKEPVRGRDSTETAPRGDLRGDIASNVRARPDPDHGAPPRRH